jgi:hypothetical protein
MRPSASSSSSSRPARRERAGGGDDRIRRRPARTRRRPRPRRQGGGDVPGVGHPAPAEPGPELLLAVRAGERASSAAPGGTGVEPRPRARAQRRDLAQGGDAGLLISCARPGGERADRREAVALAQAPSLVEHHLAREADHPREQLASATQSGPERAAGKRRTELSSTARARTCAGCGRALGSPRSTSRGVHADDTPRSSALEPRPHHGPREEAPASQAPGRPPVPQLPPPRGTSTGLGWGGERPQRIAVDPVRELDLVEDREHPPPGPARVVLTALPRYWWGRTGRSSSRRPRRWPTRLIDWWRTSPATKTPGKRGLVQVGLALQAATGGAAGAARLAAALSVGSPRARSRAVVAGEHAVEPLRSGLCADEDEQRGARGHARCR